MLKLNVNQILCLIIIVILGYMIFSENSRKSQETFGVIDTRNSEYRGNINKTITGKTCQMWTSQSPHRHNNTPQRRKDKGLGDHNYCRNPDREPGGIWCYTTDRNKRWEYCQQPRGHPDNKYYKEIAEEGGKGFLLPRINLKLIDDNDRLEPFLYLETLIYAARGRARTHKKFSERTRFSHRGGLIYPNNRTFGDPDRGHKKYVYIDKNFDFKPDEFILNPKKNRIYSSIHGLSMHRDKKNCLVPNDTLLPRRRGGGHSMSMLNSPQAWSADDYEKTANSSWMIIDTYYNHKILGVVLQNRNGRGLGRYQIVKDIEIYAIPDGELTFDQTSKDISNSNEDRNKVKHGTVNIKDENNKKVTVNGSNTINTNIRFGFWLNGNNPHPNNQEHAQISVIRFDNPVIARYVKIRVKSFYQWPRNWRYSSIMSHPSLRAGVLAKDAPGVKATKNAKAFGNIYNEYIKEDFLNKEQIKRENAKQELVLNTFLQ